MEKDRNLATRTANGIKVSLDWHEPTDEITVSVENPSANEDFTIREIPHPLALDVYRHPYAYASKLLTSGTFAKVAA